MKKEYWDEKQGCWRDEYDRRICTIKNETIDAVLDNCKEFLKYRDVIYLGDVCVLLEKALEGIKDKKDLVPVEQDAIKGIRNMIKGL